MIHSKKIISTLILLMGVLFAYPQEIRTGKLENGITYYICKTDITPGRADFFIVHNVGSLQEEDNQRGLAHFLEHMAFNGTKNFPGKSMLNYYAGIGVKFGANINAYTSMDRTVYNLSAIPVTRESIIDSSLLVLHDWSHYISCKPSEIEAERGVIREEWRRGDDARTRMMKQIFKYQQYGSRFAQRDVIGDTNIINTFKPKTLTDFYHKWYRTDLQAIVVAGDIDPDKIEKKIKERFETIPQEKKRAPRITYTIPDNDTTIIGYITDPESKGYSVRIIAKYNPVESSQKRDHISRDINEMFFTEMVKSRCNSATAQKESLVKALVPALGSISYAKKSFTITALPNGNKMRDAAVAVAKIFAQMEKYYFSQEEFNSVKKMVSRAIETNYKRSQRISNSDIVSLIVEDFTRKTPVILPNEKYNISKEILKKITLEDINKFAKEVVNGKNQILVFAAPLKEAHLLPNNIASHKLLDSIKNSPITPYKISKGKELNSTFSKESGKAILTTLADSSISITLSNGLEVIYKKGDKEGNTVQFYAARKGGYSYCPAQEFDITRTTSAFLSDMIVGGLNKQELAQWCREKNISLRASIETKEDEIAGSFGKSSTSDFFALLRAYINNSTTDKKALEKFKERTIKDIQKGKSANQIYKDSCRKLEYPGDPFNNQLSIEFTRDLTSEAINKCYSQHFGDLGDYTFYIYGNADMFELYSSLQKYISDLPYTKREISKPLYDGAEIKKGEVYIDYKADSLMSTKASIRIVWTGFMEYSAQNLIKAKYLTYILRERYMKSIREERGGTYHVGVSYGAVSYPQEAIRIAVEFDTDPKLVKELTQVVYNEINNLMKKGVTDREVTEVKLYLKKLEQENKEEDQNWLREVKNSVKGTKDLESDARKLFNNITKEQLKDFSKELFGQKNRVTNLFGPKQ